LVRRAAAATLHRLLLAVLLLGSNPLQERVGGHDGRQLAQHLPSQLLRKSYQPVLFFGRDRDAFWQLAAEDFVLDLQVFDLAGQFFLRCAGDYQQEGTEIRWSSNYNGICRRK
jgi:hypothetical protein